MTIPSRVKIEIPLLKELAKRAGSSTPTEMYQQLAAYFELTDDDLNLMTADRKEPIWHNTVRQARRTLVEKGELDKSRHGVWQITQAGYQRLHNSGSYWGDINERLPVPSIDLLEVEEYLPEELPNATQYYEGAKKRIYVNAYERNPHAREKCIAHYGVACSICGFNFEAMYGSVGKGLIHVHHLRPLSEVEEEYEVDPISDLRPVCPNCHAIIHRRRIAYSLDEVRAMINTRSE